MARQLRCRPAGRRSRQWNLGEELRSRLYPMHFSAPFGIIGAPRTGRKTLALRFAAMDAAVLPDERPQPFYNSFHVRTLRPYDYLRPVTLHLHAYICPTPPDSCSNPLFYLQEWARFCCLVFVFDVTKRETLSAAMRFMVQHANVPIRHMLVGNKCDLRVAVAQRGTVATRDVEALARRRGMIYYECSALMRTNIQRLLEDIQDCALQPTYLMNL